MESFNMLALASASVVAIAHAASAQAPLQLDRITVEATNFERIEGYTVANVYAEYQPASLGNLRLRAEVNNLFDETYADRATYGQEFGTVTPLYEPGRLIALSARLTF